MQSARRPVAMVLGLCLVAVAASLLFWRLLDHDLDRRASERFGFAAGADLIRGTLWLPDGDPAAAVALVHGDGPQDRTSDGGYAPLVNALLDCRIAVASWDKPGTGESGGAWLEQSMVDRAAETRAALAALRRRLEGVATGALGFSQAGWVLPRLSRQDAAFLVLVGPAVSWRAQGRYYTRTRLRLAGETEIAGAMAREEAADARAFRPGAAAADVTEGISPERWTFVQRNRAQNATGNLRRLDIPLLALWGGEDLNVDAAGDSAIYRETVTGRHPENRLIVLPDATHGLLKAGAYNWQLVDQWPWYAKLRFVLEGRRAFAPGSLALICEWIRRQATLAD